MEINYLARTPYQSNFECGYYGFDVMAAWLWVYILDVDAADLGLLWIIVGRFGL